MLDDGAGNLIAVSADGGAPLARNLDPEIQVEPAGAEPTEAPMDLEAQVREAIIAEVQRQAEASEGRLVTRRRQDGVLEVDGALDLEALSMAVVGALAGGP